MSTINVVHAAIPAFLPSRAPARRYARGGWHHDVLSIDRFVFRIDDVFDIAGRGRAVVGVIESGVVHVGDQLMLETASGRSEPFDVHGVSGVRDSAWKPGDPARVGLVVPDLPETAAAGDALVGLLRR